MNMAVSPNSSTESPKRTPTCSRAIEDAARARYVLVKYLSANDVGKTQSNQCGFYLPRKPWRCFTKIPPTEEDNDAEDVQILWHDGTITDSHVIWYGRSKKEYRLTRFGRNFPFRDESCLGDFLVLAVMETGHWRGYLLDIADDVDEFCAAFGLDVSSPWALIDNVNDAQIQAEEVRPSLAKRFQEFVSGLYEFPNGDIVSRYVQEQLEQMYPRFGSQDADRKLYLLIHYEYDLFRRIEEHFCLSDISGSFYSIDQFLQVALRITNRRKSRAGRCLENHVAYLLRSSGLSYTSRPKSILGEPDIVIPNEELYHRDPFVADRLRVLAIKTTCKDRWRQVVQEAPKCPEKYLLTTQKSISPAKLREMIDSGIRLVVPRPFQKGYPINQRDNLLSVSEFIESSMSLCQS